MYFLSETIRLSTPFFERGFKSNNNKFGTYKQVLLWYNQCLQNCSQRTCIKCHLSRTYARYPIGCLCDPLCDITWLPELHCLNGNGPCEVLDVNLREQKPTIRHTKYNKIGDFALLKYESDILQLKANFQIRTWPSALAPVLQLLTLNEIFTSSFSILIQWSMAE